MQSTPFSLEEARGRLLEMDETDVVVKATPSGLVLMAAVDPSIALQPVLHGRLREHEGQVVLRGRLGLNLKSRVVVTVMVAALVVLMLKQMPQSFPGALLVAVLVLLAIMCFAYAHHRRNIALIKRRVMEALSDEVASASR